MAPEGGPEREEGQFRGVLGAAARPEGQSSGPLLPGLADGRITPRSGRLVLPGLADGRIATHQRAATCAPRPGGGTAMDHDGRRTERGVLVSPGQAPQLN
jgi:hypothetical protein